MPLPTTSTFREYTYAASNCVTKKDPMNFYYGAGLGTIPVAVQKTETVGQMSWNPIASNQWMFDDGACQIQDFQRASGITGNKDHTRLNQGRWIDPQFTHITASPMHHDILALCGDVADSFNATRNVVAQRFQNAGYFAVFSFTGNVQGMIQCDGRVTASDGSYVLART